MKTLLNKLNIIVITGLLFLFVHTPVRAEAPLELNVSPESVSIGTYYQGTDITVSGKIPADCEAVAVFTGEGKELHLKEKGKALGLLWMNMDTLTFKNVPAVFFVVSRQRIEEMTTPEGSEVQEIGFEGLSRQITLESEKTDPQFYIQELFNLKKHEKLYQEQIGNQITYAEPVQGVKAFQAVIHLPSRLLPGNYHVNVYAIQNGRLLNQEERQVDVELTEMPSFLAGMAFGHGLMYGILATVIAIVAGLVIGLMFQGSKGGAH